MDLNVNSISLGYWIKLLVIFNSTFYAIRLSAKFISYTVFVCSHKKKSELSIEYGRTFQILFGEYYYSSYRYRLTLSMATLCKASQDFLPNPL